MIHRCQLMRFYQCPLSARFGRALMTVLGRKAVTRRALLRTSAMLSCPEWQLSVMKRRNLTFKTRQSLMATFANFAVAQSVQTGP